jgi:uncharacterized membrane protein YeaQ/YmgE (transglycosylase-associated protein family)
MAPLSWTPARIAAVQAAICPHSTAKRSFFMSIVWTILIGFIVGLVARAVKPGDDSAGFIVTTLIGVAGSLIVTYVGQSMGWYTAGQGAGFIASVLGAIVLLLLYGLVKRKR